MTYDDIEATDKIREYWAGLMKTLQPKLYEYMMRAKYEYANRTWLDDSTDPVFTIDDATRWIEGRIENDT